MDGAGNMFTHLSIKTWVHRCAAGRKLENGVKTWAPTTNISSPSFFQQQLLWHLRLLKESRPEHKNLKIQCQTPDTYNNYLDANLSLRIIRKGYLTSWSGNVFSFRIQSTPPQYWLMTGLKLQGWNVQHCTSMTCSARPFLKWFCTLKSWQQAWAD